MALNPKLSHTASNAEAAAVSALCNTGYLRLYTGTQPTDANTAIGAQVKAAELRFGSTAFAAPVNGVATANAITSDTNAVGGTVTWFRVFQSDGTTVLYDGTVGISGCNINLNSNIIAAGAQVDVTTFSFTASEG
jgi:hypothetical protein